jgi:hypothetical protein
MEKSRRVYGYLHFRYQRQNVSKYIGEATADSREEALRLAWSAARKKGLLTKPIQLGDAHASRRRAR